jgi:hypothetical protein
MQRNHIEQKSLFHVRLIGVSYSGRACFIVDHCVLECAIACAMCSTTELHKQNRCNTCGLPVLTTIGFIIATICLIVFNVRSDNGWKVDEWSVYVFGILGALLLIASVLLWIRYSCWVCAVRSRYRDRSTERLVPAKPVVPVYTKQPPTPAAGYSVYPPQQQQQPPPTSAPPGKYSAPARYQTPVADDVSPGPHSQDAVYLPAWAADTPEYKQKREEPKPGEDGYVPAWARDAM